MTKRVSNLFLILTILTLILSACGGGGESAAPAKAPAADTAPTTAPAEVAPAEAAPAAAAPAEAAPAEAAPAAEQPAAAPSGAPQEIAKWGQGRINGLAYIAAGKTLVIGTYTGIFVYDTTTWETPRLIDTGAQSTYSMAVSADGQMVAAGMVSGVIQLYQISDGKMLRELKGHTDTVTSVAFSPDGQTLVSGSDDWAFSFWKVSDGSLLQNVDGYTTSRVNAVAFSTDGSLAAIALEYPDNKILLWKVGSEEPVQVLTGHADAVSDVIFSPDNSTLASSSRDGLIKIWQVNNGAAVKSLSTENLPEVKNAVPTPIPASADTSEEEKQQLDEIQKAKEAVKMPFVFNLAYSPDGQTIAAGYFDNVVRLWKVSDGSLLNTLKGHQSMVFNLAFSPDGSSLASRSLDGTARIWQTSDGANTKTLDFGFGVQSLAYSPDGSTLAIGGEANDLQLRQTSDGALLRDLTGHFNRITSVAFSPDGTRVAAGSIDFLSMIWQASDGTFQYALPMKGSVYSVAFSPDGTSFVAGAGGANVAAVWNVADGKALRGFTGHTGAITSLTYSPDGTMLATGSSDQTVRLWFVQEAKQIGSFTGHLDRITGVAFSPNGETLISVSMDRSMRVWQVPGGEALKTVELEAGIASVAYSKDGNLLALGLENGSVALFQAQNLDKPSVVFPAHKLDVNSIVFSPDDKVLASGSKDGTIKFWQVK